MGHKAGKSFFEEKPSWSVRKDLVLSYYLTPYLPMMATQKRPIMLVDAFAGPGRFEDGSEGSPLIISNIAKNANEKPLPVPVSVLAIEPNDDLYARLLYELEAYPHSQTKKSTFVEAIPDIEKAVSTHSVFLYLDPWTVEGLEWEALTRVFAYLQKGHSVEVLMNFNAHSFVRRGLSALALSMLKDLDDADDTELPLPPPSIASLDRVVGSNWWQAILKANADDGAKAGKAITDGFCHRLRTHFQEVCVHEMLDKYHHRVPKYYMLFGSRSSKALPIMNDAMFKSREMLAQSTAAGTLFESDPLYLVSDETKLPSFVLSKLKGKMPRGELIESVMRSHFGVYRETMIRRIITALIQEGRISSMTGKAKINNTELIWRTQPATS